MSEVLAKLEKKGGGGSSLDGMWYAGVRDGVSSGQVTLGQTIAVGAKYETGFLADITQAKPSTMAVSINGIVTICGIKDGVITRIRTSWSTTRASYTDSISDYDYIFITMYCEADSTGLRVTFS